jgi:hypothetical protein
MQNWQTTIIGAICLIGSIVLFALGRPVEGSMMLPVAIGFWRSKDAAK